MYRAGANRSGYTSEEIEGKLQTQWEFQLPQAPQPAWPRDERMPFDRAPQMVATGNRVLFGSTTDCKLYALEAKTGRVAWTFTADGPIR